MKEEGKISFGAAVLMNINIIVGSSIFFNPQAMTAKAGSLSFLSWPLAGLLLFPIIWSVAQAARVFPGAGGFYHYCKSGLNESAGFLANWAYLLGYLGTAATLISVIATTLSSYQSLEIIRYHPIIFNIIFVTAISLLNLVSVELISKIQSSVTIFKITPLFIVVAILFFYWNPSITYDLSNFIHIPAILPLAVFGYWGFESCCSISHYIKGGPTQAARVILVAFSITALLYCIFHFGVMHIMGVENLSILKAADFPNYLGLAPWFTNALLVGISLAIMASYINTAYGASFTNITNLHGLAQRKLISFSSFLSKTTARNVPTSAVIVHGIVIFFLITFITIPQVLMAMTNLGVILAFVLTLCALTRYYLKNNNYIKVTIPILGLCACAILFYLSWTALGTTFCDQIFFASPILVGLILGIIMYKYSTRHNKKLA
jgi:APA family basic amino acid/polyamine antiporter